MANKLTTNQGAPVPDDQNSLTAGRRGPMLLADHHLLEKLAHFNRERIPERVVNARGASAFGIFRPEPGLHRFTKAVVFARDMETPVAVRFSTFTHSRHSPETVRDPRGFAVKFYTTEGNYDLVGSSLPVFFIRDPMRFPDLVHALKPDPATAVQDPNRLFDFLSFAPECTHMLIWLYSDRGIPSDYRHLEGYGVHTYVWTNARGEQRYVRYTWKPFAGVKCMTREEAARTQAQDFSHATRDLYAALAKGGTVEFELYVQLMHIKEEEESFAWDPLDVTKIWPEDAYPLRRAGSLSLNRGPVNEFAENEQLAFAPSAVVSGIDLSADKLLQGRSFAYPDSQRHRLGANYLQLPVNRPKIAVRNVQQDGPMSFEFSGSHVNYQPSTTGENLPTGTPLDYPMPLVGTVSRERIPKTDDYTQAGLTWRRFEESLRISVVENLGDELSKVRDDEVVDTIIGFLSRADALLGESVRRRARGDLADPAQLLKPSEPVTAAASPA
jgi:catalase